MCNLSRRSDHVKSEWQNFDDSVIISDVTMVTADSDGYTVHPKKYAHGFCFAVLCCGYTLTDFPISIRLTSLALWQSNDCPSASKATLMNMDKYFMWIHCEWLHNHNKAKHNKTVCIFLGIYCTCPFESGQHMLTSCGSFVADWGGQSVCRSQESCQEFLKFILLIITCDWMIYASAS